MNRWKVVLVSAAVLLGAAPSAARAQTLYARTLIEAVWGNGAPQAASHAVGLPGIVVDDAATPSSEADLSRLSPVQRVGLIRNMQGLIPVRLANGAMMIHLAGRYREFAIARVDGSGRSWVGCVHGEPALQKALDDCTPVAPPRFEDR